MNLKTMRVSFPGQVDEQSVVCSVVAAEYRGQWVLCRHQGRSTLECPGGRRAEGETPEQTARRKLYEETGATQYELTCVCPYAVSLPQGEKEYGMLFFAHVEELGPLPPQSRMAEVQLWEHMPSDNWTYPDIQPFLVARIRDSYSV